MRSCSKLGKVFLAAMVHELYKTGMSETTFEKFLMSGKGRCHGAVFGKYQQKAESFMCSCLGKNSRNAQKTPGGLIYRQRWNNLQFVTSASFLLTGTVTPPQILAFAKSQVNLS